MMDLFEITLGRSDINNKAIITPISVGNIKRSIEDEGSGRRKATSPSMSLTFMTEDVIDFITPYPSDPASIYCVVKYYKVFDETNKFIVFTGVSDVLPSEKIIFNNELLTINFISPLINLENGSDIEDTSGTKDVYYTFVTIKEALDLVDEYYNITGEGI